MGCAIGLFLTPAAVRAEEHSKLGEEMEALDDAIKGFRKETDPAEGAAMVREAQTATLKSIPLLPAMVKKMPDGPDKDKAAAAYRTAMAKLLVALCEAEEAFVNGKPEEVAKIVDALKTVKKEGHNKFMEE